MLPTKVPVRFHYGSGLGSRVTSFVSIQVPVVPVCVLRAHIATVFLCHVGKFETHTGTGTNWNQDSRPRFCFRLNGSGFWFWLLLLIVAVFAYLKGGSHAH
jgi:hypothetical protein